MPTDEEYYRWVFTTFGNDYDIWHDGLLTGRVSSLTGEARERALSMLHKGIELKDSRAAEALAAMGEMDVLPALRAELAQARGDNKIRIVLAILEMSPDESLARNLTDMLEDGSLFWGDRKSAAVELGHLRDTMSEQALLKAVEHDRNYLVRYNAANSLLKRWVHPTAHLSSYRDISDPIGSPYDGPINAEEQDRLSTAMVCLESLRPEE